MTIDASSVKNIFSSLAQTSVNGLELKELSEILLDHPNLTIERIVSNGQHSPQGFWYDQAKDEWVILLTGKAELEFEDSVINLQAGDYIFIPAHHKHRVNSTSSNPNCIWLAIHGDLNLQIN